MKKRKTIITVTVLILVLLVVILLSLRGCTSESVDPSEEEAKEASELETTEEVTEYETIEEVTEVESAEAPSEYPMEDSTEAPTEESTEDTTESTSESTVDETTTAHQHDYTNKEVITATCTERGYTRYTCECGKYYDASYTDALGHNFSAWIVTKEATATERGIMERHCNRCTETEVIPATGKPDSPSEPVETEPQPTIPPVIEQPTTDPKPTGCSHVWLEIYHEAETHDFWWVVCKCGTRFATFEEWQAHRSSFYGTGEEVMKHTGWYEERETIIDSPTYSTWVCSKCGETRDTQP